MVQGSKVIFYQERKKSENRIRTNFSKLLIGRRKGVISKYEEQAAKR